MDRESTRKWTAVAFEILQCSIWNAQDAAAQAAPKAAMAAFENEIRNRKLVNLNIVNHYDNIFAGRRGGGRK